MRKWGNRYREKEEQMRWQSRQKDGVAGELANGAEVALAKNGNKWVAVAAEKKPSKWGRRTNEKKKQKVRGQLRQKTKEKK